MKRKGIVVAAAAGVVVLAALSLSSCEKSPVPEKAEKIRIGIYPDPICALIYIGQEQAFFKRHGLEVSIQNYQAGTYAISDLLESKVDVATAADYVLALQGFKREDLRGVGTISLFQSHEMVARKDRGIGKPEDLRGKVIGVPRGAATEYFLSTFLTFNNIHSREVHLVDLKPSEMVTALSQGKIDAASCFPPSTDEMRRNLTQNAISWPLQGGQDCYFLLITSEELIKTRPHVITSLLKGVLESEAFLKKHEKEAQSIVERTLGLDHEAVLKTWSKTRFRVGLDQALLTLMEDEARWAIQNRLVEAKKVPNYLNFFYLEGLEKLKPDAVGVIH